MVNSHYWTNCVTILFNGKERQEASMTECQRGCSFDAAGVALTMLRLACDMGRALEGCSVKLTPALDGAAWVLVSISKA